MKKFFKKKDGEKDSSQPDQPRKDQPTPDSQTGEAQYVPGSAWKRKKATKETEDYLSSLANSVLKKDRKTPPREGEKPDEDDLAFNPHYKDMIQGLSEDKVEGLPRSGPPRQGNPESQRVPQTPARQQTKKPRPQGIPQSRVGSPPSPQQVPPTQKPPQPQVVQESRDHIPVGEDGTFVVGTMLLFEDDSIGVYKDQRTAKEYEVVTMLMPDGGIRAQGIALDQYDVTPIGFLPREFMHRLHRRKTWDRDEIVFHLESFGYCKYVPFADPDLRDSAIQDFEPEKIVQRPRDPQTPSAPKPKEDEPKKLVAGRKFTINFGSKDWEAIYWGEDDLGPIVAHNTHEKWALMHLDLRRFEDSLRLGEMASPELLAKMKSDIAAG